MDRRIGNRCFDPKGSSEEKLFEDNLAILYFIHTDFFNFRSSLTLEGGVQGHRNAEITAADGGV